MSTKRIPIFAALIGLAFPWAAARADVRIGVGFGRPCYRRPCYGYPYGYRVYVGGPPVILAPAAVVVAPGYVVPAPAPVIIIPPQPAGALQPVPGGAQALPMPITPVTNSYSAPGPQPLPTAATDLPPAPLPVGGLQ
jgi:hypothetical protein